jgi:hypothetical protein
MNPVRRYHSDSAIAIVTTSAFEPEADLELIQSGWDRHRRLRKRWKPTQTRYCSTRTWLGSPLRSHLH